MEVCLLPPLPLCHRLSSDLRPTRLLRQCVCVCAQIYIYRQRERGTKTYLFNVVVVFLDAVTVAWCSHLNSLFPPGGVSLCRFRLLLPERDGEGGKKATFRKWRMIHRACLFLGFMVFRWWHQWNVKTHNIQCSPRRLIFERLWRRLFLAKRQTEAQLREGIAFKFVVWLKIVDQALPEEQFSW